MAISKSPPEDVNSRWDTWVFALILFPKASLSTNARAGAASGAGQILHSPADSNFDLCQAFTCDII